MLVVHAVPALTCGCGGPCAGLTAGDTQAAPGGSRSHVKRGRGGDSPAFVGLHHLKRCPCGLEGRR